MKHPTLTHDAGFDEFWAEYPKHVKKKDAKKAWQQLRPTRALLDQILAALRWQRNTPAWLQDGGAYIPHAGTWIRGERWEDEPCDTRPILGKANSRLAAAIARIKATEGE